MLNEVFNFEKITSACQFICWFFFLNLLFLISNAPVVIFILGVGIDQMMNYLPFFLLCMVPLGPSLCGMFGSMRRLMKEKDVRPLYQYGRTYLQNAKQSYAVSVLLMLVLFVLLSNLYLFTKIHYFLPGIVFFGFLTLLILCMMPHIYMLMTRYRMKIGAILKDALILTITRPGMTLGNIAAFFAVCMLFEIKAGTFFLFIGSIYVFLVLFMNRRLYQQLDESAQEYN